MSTAVQNIPPSARKNSKRRRGSELGGFPTLESHRPSNHSAACHKEDQVLLQEYQNILKLAKRRKHPLLMQALKKGLKPGKQFQRTLTEVNGKNPGKDFSRKEEYTIIVIVPTTKGLSIFPVFGDEIKIVCRHEKVPGRRTFILSSLEGITAMK